MARTDNFQKFVKQKKSGTIKEEFRQKKKKEKKERAAAIEAHFERKRAERLQRQSATTAAVKKGRAGKFVKDEAERPSGKTGAPGKFTRNDNEQTKAKALGLRQNNAGNEAEQANIKTERPNKYPKKATAETAERKEAEKASTEQMPLNKFIAHSGICSRRDAAALVKDGKVTVNGTPATDPGMKVVQSDLVKVGNKKVTPSKNFVYILLNKPKDFITTSEDPQGRKTVLDLVRTATEERVYPVGRLDRNTSGVLLLTNDGELAQKLSHPSHEVKKVYEVKVDRPVTKADLDTIASGITLEDGFVAPDVVAYADAKDKSIIGIEIHSGRNRIVRRIFEHLKYDVKGLDRVMYAGLTKKDVLRGRWRFLKEKEVRLLKFMNKSFVKV